MSKIDIKVIILIFLPTILGIVYLYQNYKIYVFKVVNWYDIIDYDKKNTLIYGFNPIEIERWINSSLYKINVTIEVSEKDSNESFLEYIDNRMFDLKSGRVYSSSNSFYKSYSVGEYRIYFSRWLSRIWDENVRWRIILGQNKIYVFYPVFYSWKINKYSWDYIRNNLNEFIPYIEISTEN